MVRWSQSDGAVHTHSHTLTHTHTHSHTYSFMIKGPHPHTPIHSTDPSAHTHTQTDPGMYTHTPSQHMSNTDAICSYMNGKNLQNKSPHSNFNKHLSKYTHSRTHRQTMYYTHRAYRRTGRRCFPRHDKSPAFSSNETNNKVQMESLWSVMAL